MLTGSNMYRIKSDDPALASHFFDGPWAYATGNKDATQNQVSAGLSATPTLAYASYRRFSSDVRMGRIVPAIRAVMYDPENWPQTPEVEKRDPYSYFRKFSRLARARGYYVFQAPARDLMAVPGARCGRRRGETLSDAFIRCNVAGAAARYADTLEIQAQRMENDPTGYRCFVKATADQARASKPSIDVMANLSTSPANYVATASMLLDAHNAVRDLVSGHYLSIDARETSVAETFLRLLSG